jgi:oligosaccharyltransferase complex subunit alpha (ribophorin I)
LNGTVFPLRLPAPEAGGGAGGGAGVVEVTAVFTDCLRPNPPEISQRDAQFMELLESYYYYSLYETRSQETLVSLPRDTRDVTFPALPPSALREGAGGGVSLGPYADVAPLTRAPCPIRCLHNGPFAQLTAAARELDVSGWGAVGVEELYGVRHAGAALRGAFSRADYDSARDMSGGGTAQHSIA